MLQHPFKNWNLTHLMKFGFWYFVCYAKNLAFGTLDTNASANCLLHTLNKF